jgi:hypothetical protein
VIINECGIYIQSLMIDIYHPLGHNRREEKEVRKKENVFFIYVCSLSFFK